MRWSNVVDQSVLERRYHLHIIYWTCSHLRFLDDYVSLATAIS